MANRNRPVRRLHVHREPDGRSPMASAYRGERHEFLRIHLPCNQSCLFCSIVYSAEDDGLHAAEVLERIDAMGRERVTSLTLTGGEPTTNPRFLDFVARAREAGIERLVIETNATRFAEDELAAKVRAAHPGASCFVSLHSHRADVSDLITQDPGGFEHTLAGLAAMRDAGLPSTLNHVLIGLNAPELPAFVDFVADRHPEVGHVTVSFVAAINRAADHDWIVPRIRDVRPFLRDAIARAASRGVRLRIPDRCGVPPCILPEHAQLHDTLTVPESVEIPLGRDRHQGGACQACVLRRRCLGLWSAYAALHGDAELRPLTRDPDGRLVATGAELEPIEELRPPGRVEPDARGLPEPMEQRYRDGETRSRVNRLIAEALFFRERGQTEAALRSTCGALSLVPEHGEARTLFVVLSEVTHVRRARTMMDEGRLAEAREVLRWVLVTHREHPGARAAWRDLTRLSGARG